MPISNLIYINYCTYSTIKILIISRCYFSTKPALAQGRKYIQTDKE